jgi:hypothetical protein
MKHRILLVAAILGASTVRTPAQPYPDGQRPAPPSIAARSALPECGFAAIESWGPNGFQYCDPRNVRNSNAGRSR